MTDARILIEPLPRSPREVEDEADGGGELAPVIDLRARRRAPAEVVEADRTAIGDARVDVAAVLDVDPVDAPATVPGSSGRLPAVGVGVLGLLGVVAAAFGGLVVLALVGVVVVGSPVAYIWVLRPRLQAWGATDAEATAPLPGDELVDAAAVTTRAVTIDAPVEQVWRWLVALGIGPDGWRDDACCGGPSLAGGEIAPRLRDLGAGRAAMPGAGFVVHRVEAPSSIVSQGDDGTTWCLQLVDSGSGRSRLLSRFRSPVDAVVDPTLLLADLHGFVVERRTLQLLRRRAESGAPSVPCERLYAP